ncbi:S8 family serine peptidase, partial [Chloroflexota bacterium]
MRMYLTVLASLTLLVSLIFGGLFPTPTASAGDGGGEKVSSMLAFQVEAKIRAAKAGGAPAAIEASLQEDRVDILQASGMKMEDLNKQQVFIHVTEEPTQSQIRELGAMGITLYPDSWIPPIGVHPTGFITADMPVDSLRMLASKNYVVRLDTAEQQLEPQNDSAAVKINADDVWGLSYNGTGVTIAVLDSGFQVGSIGHAAKHGDFPPMTAGIDYKDYSNSPDLLDDDVANQVTGHGTHVAGSVLGRGAQSGGAYKGMAPGATPVFLKIGNDTNGGATTAAEVNAIKAAVDTYGADIITMSYGGWSTHHDGTDQVCQAVDYAVSQGAVVFISAGNEANGGEHYSGTVDALSETGYIQVNVAGATANKTVLLFNMVWYDGTSTSNDLELKYYDSIPTLLASINGTQADSSRGTEQQWSYYDDYVPYSGNSTYYLKVQNNSESSQFFHLYYSSALNLSGAGTVRFDSPDSNYTISSPAEADSAIAVGAYTTRESWIDYTGIGSYTYNQTLDAISSFSSQGPRVDTGATPKPNIVAPGSAIISCRDDDVYTWPGGANPLFIDNDGTNNGLGPADYYVMQGTSMACPIAAGIGALILEKNPEWTAAQVKHALEAMSSDNGTAGWDSTYGWGLIDAYESVNSLVPTISSYDNDTHTSPSDNFTVNDTAYMHSINLLPSYDYRVTYYDGNNNKVITDNITSGSSGNFSSQHTFVEEAGGIGLWHVVVCERSFNAPTSYNSTWSYLIASDNFTFHTLEPPVVNTENATEIGVLSATLNGILESRGDYSSVNVSFEWGDASDNLTEKTTSQVMISTGDFSDNISGLLSNTTYYFKAKVTADGTAAYGNEFSFTTKTLVSINIIPDNLVLTPGKTQQFTATGNCSDNSTDNITGAVTWISDNTSVAWIDAAGLATSVVAGNTTISATLGEISGNTTLSVTSSVEVNSGETIVLTESGSLGGSLGGILLDIKGIPYNGPSSGISEFILNISWDSSVIEVDNVTAASIAGFDITAGTPNNTLGTANVTGNTSGSYLTGDKIVAALGISTVGTAGESTSINVTITKLIDNNSIPV